MAMGIVLLLSFVFVCVPCITIPIFAWKYKELVVDRKPPWIEPVQQRWRVHELSTGFRVGLCDCFSDCNVCVHTCCCYYVRLAETYTGAGLGSFWRLFFVAVGFRVAGTCASLLLGGCGDLACIIMFAVYFSYKRGALRERLGGAGCTCMDCCCIFTFGECAACQEARTVDGLLGVTTACCCRLRETPLAEGLALSVVGEPRAILQPLPGNQRALPVVAPQEMQAFAVPNGQVYTGVVVQGSHVDTSSVARGEPAPGEYVEMR